MKNNENFKASLIDKYLKGTCPHCSNKVFYFKLINEGNQSPAKQYSFTQPLPARCYICGGTVKASGAKSPYLWLSVLGVALLFIFYFSGISFWGADALAYFLILIGLTISVHSNHLEKV